MFDQQPYLWCQEGVAIAVLATYTWSFLQFTLVFTATADTIPDTKLEKVTSRLFPRPLMRLSSEPSLCLRHEVERLLQIS